MSRVERATEKRGVCSGIVGNTVTFPASHDQRTRQCAAPSIVRPTLQVTRVHEWPSRLALVPRSSSQET